MKQLANRLEDVQEKTGDLFTKMLAESGILGLFERGVRNIEKSWLNLSPIWNIINQIIGETTEKIKDLGAAIPEITDEFFDEDEFTDYVKIMQTYATSWASVGDGVMMTAKGFKQLNPEARTFINESMKDFKTNFEQIKPLADDLLNTFNYIFTETLIREQNFADSMVAAFAGMLLRMEADLMAKSALFGVLSIFGAGPVGGFLNFVTGGLFSHEGGGLSPSRSPSSGGSVTINMPNVTMINSRSIAQLDQALSRHRRLH